MTEQRLIPVETIAATILTIRGQRVIIDADLARLYGVETRALNQAVKRNARRFPEDFLFQLTAEESASLTGMRSQFVIASKRNVRYLPYAFTEHGALMAANVLNSERAEEVSVYVVRAFVQQRAMLASHTDLALRLSEVERRLQSTFAYQEARLDDHENQLEQILELVPGNAAAAQSPPHRLPDRQG